MPQPDRPHATRSLTDQPPRTRSSNTPPTDLNSQYQSAPPVSQISDTATRQRVINALHHAQHNPLMYNALKLLIGMSYDASALLPYVPLDRSGAVSQFAQISNTSHLTKVLDAFEAFIDARHADNLVTIIAGYNHSTLSSPALKDAYIAIACKIGLSATASHPEVFRHIWRPLTNRRLAGLNALVHHAGFADAALTPQDREKLLWVFEFTMPSVHDLLFLLLAQHRDRFAAQCWRPMPPDINMPIVSIDFTSASATTSNRLLDHLNALALSTSVADEFLFPHPPASTLSAAQKQDYRDAAKTRLLSELIRDVADPDGSIRQGTAGTCPWTSLLNRVATMRPAEYTRMAKSLIVNGSVTFDWNNNTTASQFYSRQFVPSLPPTADADFRNRFDPYWSGPTTIPLARRSGDLPGWNADTGRTVVQQVLQQSIARFVNTGNGTPRDEGALHPLDLSIFAVNMLGALRGFRLCSRLFDVSTVSPTGGESVCRVTTRDTWLDELATQLRLGNLSTFLTLEWAPGIPSNGVMPHACAGDRSREPYRWEHGDCHVVHLRAVRSAPWTSVGYETRVYFWNPWGAAVLTQLLPSNTTRNPVEVASLEDDNSHEIASHEPSGVVWRVSNEHGVSHGIGFVTSEEFKRSIRTFFYLDPDGPPWMDLPGS